MATTSLKARILLLALGSSLAFGFGELLVRGLEYAQYFIPSNRAQFVQYAKVYSDERGKDYVFGHLPNIEVTLERDGYQYTVVTNSDGLRERQDYGPLERSVIFLGDSIVEGASVGNDETMDEVFERLTGITTLNFGVGSSNTAHQVRWLAAKAKPEYNPRLVVLGFCLNDFPQNTYLRYFDPALGNWPLYEELPDEKTSPETSPSTEPTETGSRGAGTFVKRLAKKSRLLTFVYGSLSRLHHRGADPLPFTADQVSPKQKRFTERHLLAIRQRAEALGAELVVVLFPQASQLRYDYEPGERMQDVLLEILERQGIESVDLYDPLKAAYLADPETRWYHDDTHPYKAGHRLIGESLARVLPERFPAIFEREAPE